MVIVDAYGTVKSQSWSYTETIAQITQLRSVIVSPQLLQSVDPKDTALLNQIGVRLTVDESICDIEAYVGQLPLIELAFTSFKDGRPFSTAVALRQDCGFKNDLRASGDIIPDQALFLIRSGFSSMVIPVDFTAAQFQSALTAYSLAYQPSHDNALNRIVSLRRSL